MIYYAKEGDAALAAALSQAFACMALVVWKHDSDVLHYRLYEAGALSDDYESWPDYFDGVPSVPRGGNATRLCTAFGAAEAVNAVTTILRAASDDEGYVFADDRHRDLCQALGLPAVAVGFGYRYLERGEAPWGLVPSLLRKTGT
ncbi:MAG: hypothetical protein ACR2JY_15805 [Chloroflexota bacterium]